MNAPAPNSHRSQIPRFILVGAGNAIVTIAVYQVLLPFVHYQIAYLLAWLVGIAYVVVIYPRFVFKTEVRTRTGNILVVISYVVSYLVSATLLGVITKLLGIPPWISIFLSTLGTITINYLVLNKLFDMLRKHYEKADADATQPVNGNDMQPVTGRGKQE